MLDTLFMGHSDPNDAGMYTDLEFVRMEIESFLSSPGRRAMLDGERYYCGKHDILARNRTAIGENGSLITLDNLPNNRVVDNQYKKMADQKCNYLLGKQATFKTENAAYSEQLKNIFGKRFCRLLREVGADALNCGIGWLFVYYDERGELCFNRIRPFELIPEWHDAEHTILDAAVRIYDTIRYENNVKKIVHNVEIYAQKGISYFVYDNGVLIPNAPFFNTYITVDGEGYNWSRIPLVAFKYNSKEIPLLNNIRALQDGLNVIESDFLNAMQEDTHNTVLVLKNYEGENLGEFRKNLAVYGAVKVSSIDGADGGVQTLKIDVNSDNYRTVLEIFKKAIIENAMGYDAKDDRLSGNPNQMNIQSMYSDIDLDANGMETEFQASFEELLYFVNAHLANTGVGNFDGEDVEVIFNRDILISETEIIENCVKSVGMLSDETIIAMHPWVNDPQKEMERVQAQRESETAYDDDFHPKTAVSDEY